MNAKATSESYKLRNGARITALNEKKIGLFFRDKKYEIIGIGSIDDLQKVSAIVEKKFSIADLEKFPKLKNNKGEIEIFNELLKCKFLEEQPSVKTTMAASPFQEWLRGAVLTDSRFNQRLEKISQLSLSIDSSFNLNSEFVESINLDLGWLPVHYSICEPPKESPTHFIFITDKFNCPKLIQKFQDLEYRQILVPLVVDSYGGFQQPWMERNKTGCPHCICLRFVSNSSLFDSGVVCDFGSQSSFYLPIILRSTIWHLISTELEVSSRELTSKCHIFDFFNFNFEKASVAPVPECPYCGKSDSNVRI